MEELIKLRSLSDELNDDEYNQFIMKLIKLKGRDLFSKLIFNTFKNTPESVTPFANIIRNIINSRKSIPNEEKSYKYNCLDTLPSALIAECSSYLEATEYFVFGKVNRKIYASIYSPSRIHKLSYDFLKKHYQQINMKRFKNIQKAQIYIDKFDELSTLNRSIWQTTNKINTLHIYNNADQVTMEGFLINNHINFENITKLQVSPTHYELTETLFFKMISQFPMLKYLGLDEAYLGDNEDIVSWNDNNIKMNCIKIKGLLIGGDCDPDLGTKLVNTLSNQLELLSIDNDGIIISSNKFPKLKVLELGFVETELLDSFKNITTLQTVIFRQWQIDCNSKQFIERMLKNQSSLKRLSVIVYNGDILNAMKGAETALFWLKDKKRKSNSLFIEFEQHNKFQQEGIQTIQCRILWIIHALEMIEKIENWRIKIKIPITKNNLDEKSNEMKEWLNKLENVKQKYLVHYEFVEEYLEKIFTLIISNNECNICGYHIKTFTSFL